MKVWMMVDRDPGYYGETVNTHYVEEHDSLKAAKDSFWRDCDGERLSDPRNTTARIFFYDPREHNTFKWNDDPNDDWIVDAYPDRLLSYGPRGGVRVEYA